MTSEKRKRRRKNKNYHFTAPEVPSNAMPNDLACCIRHAFTYGIITMQEVQGYAEAYYSRRRNWRAIKNEIEARTSLIQAFVKERKATFNPHTGEHRGGASYV